ncbi:MAG: DUF2075 domain-containing protein [Rhodospirillaceae bacterium]|nr:DUF2075 domain-containing protein [Rhodospirillaceae bacterium]
MQDSFGHADNLETRVKDLVRPIVAAGDCLIVTGYQDFLSAMDILLSWQPDLANAPAGTVRIVFGENTATTTVFRPGRSLSETARSHWLGQRGLSVIHQGDLRAVLALEAVKSRAIELRIYDTEAARAATGRPVPDRLHAKIVAGPTAIVSGSANFSRAGLYQNVEFTDESRAGTARYDHRREHAELFWELGEPWQETAIEILEKLLRFVTPQDAACRAHLEMLGFQPWKELDVDRAGGDPPLPYQTELVYEAAATVYEHGVAFVEAPAGAGKTKIGLHLAAVLARLHRDVVPGTSRDGSFAIVPAAVKGNWDQADPAMDAVTVTSFETREHKAIEGNRGRFRKARAAVVDEAHRLNSRWAEKSRRSQAFMECPAIWSVHLSATLLGNQDVTSLAALHEARASLYMTREFSGKMNAVFREVRLAKDGYEEDMFGEVTKAWNRRKYRRPSPLQQRPPGQLDLAPAIRQELSGLLAPFLCRRTRSCIGQTAKRVSPLTGQYPIANPPQIFDHADKGGRQQVVSEIERHCKRIAVFNPRVEEEQTRAGPAGLRVLDEGQLKVRTFLNLLRSSMEFARWEWREGKAGLEMRCLELKLPKGKWEAWQKNYREHKRAPAEVGTLFDGMPTSTPICDEIEQLLSDPALDGIDVDRADSMFRIVEDHSQVVFLTERIAVLRVYAELLQRRLGEPGAAIAVSDSRKDLVPTGFVMKTLKKLRGDDDHKFRHVHVRKTEDAQDWMALGGKRAEPGRHRAIFLHYERAEGINLQHASAVGMIGITSNIRSVVQGMGRIDRIDSPHPKIHYYTFDLSGVTLSSDRRVPDRTAGMAALAAGGGDHGERDWENLTAGELPQAIYEVIHEPRYLRPTHFHDTLGLLRRDLDDNAYKRVEASAPTGRWGAELCLLTGQDPFSLFVLGGIDDPASATCRPPRLIAVDDSGRTVRNQVACANLLLNAYRATLKAGQHETPSPAATRERMISDIQSRAGGLTQWDLRPERVVELLATLAEFLGLDAADQGRSAFASLDLPSLELLTDHWAAELDGSCTSLKQSLTTRLKPGAPVADYLSATAVVKRFNEDPAYAQAAMAARDRFRKEIGLLRQACEGKPLDIMGDICVVFHCVKVSTDSMA